MAGSPSTPPPISVKPKDDPLDDSWDDLVGGALGSLESDKPPSSQNIFNRTTTVPDSPEDPADLGLEIDIIPLRVPGQFDDDPPTRPGIETSGLRTRPSGQLSALEVSDAEVSTKKTSPGATAQVPPEEGLDAELSTKKTNPGATAQVPVDDAVDRDTPLDLVERYRASSNSATFQSGGDAHESTEGREGSRDGVSLQEMQDRYAVGDYTGALVMAESILEGNPDHEDAKRYAQSCREVLTQMYAARIGQIDQIPTVAIPADQITWLSLDHRAGFLLSLVDGVSSIEEILDISGMSRLDALRIMYTLVQQNVITLDH